MLITILSLWSPDALAAEPVKLKKLLPEPIPKVVLGSSMTKVRKKRSRAYPNDKATSDDRQEYVEDFIGHPSVRAVEYYFDADLPDNPLYEVVYSFRSRELPMTVATETFGPPNHKDTEWRFPVAGRSYELAVWTHEQRMYVVVAMDGTEWAGGVQ